MKKVLVISNKSDIHTDAIVTEIQNLSGEVVRINTEDFRKNLVKIYPIKDIYEVVTPEGRTIDFKSIKSAHIRRLSQLIDVSDVHQDFQKFAREESEVVLDSLPLVTSAYIRWLNKLSERLKATNKIWQLFQACAVGLDIPQTLITNVSEEVKFFWENLSSTIYKPLKHPIIDRGDQGRSMVSPTLLTSAHISNLSDSFSVTCSHYQKYVEKLYELRIHIIDNEVIPIKIDSQKYRASRLDWRELQSSLDYEVASIPRVIEQKLLNLMNLLSIKFGIVDMIVSPSGEYVFLEVNPDGNWLWIEDKIGVPITRSIASWLLAD